MWTDILIEVVAIPRHFAVAEACGVSRSQSLQIVKGSLEASFRTGLGIGQAIVAGDLSTLRTLVLSVEKGPLIAEQVVAWTGIVKLLSWNLRHGGGDRRDAICSAIACHDPDVIVLSEVRTHSVSEIRASLWMQNWEHNACSPFGLKTNGVCILSRVPVCVRDRCPVPEENAARWLDVDVLPCGLGIGALHIPGKGRDGVSKRRFWTALVKAAGERIYEPFIFIGDLNTGLRGIDARGRSFVCDKEFEQMTTLGWTDAWRRFHGTAFEPSWISNKGNGFRIDHAFVSTALLPRLISCEYSHSEREKGLSDHSILIVEIASRRWWKTNELRTHFGP